MTDAYQIDLERGRSVGGILLATLRLYRRYPLLFAVLALGVIAPYRLAVLAITGYGPLSQGSQGGALSILLLLLSISLLLRWFPHCTCTRWSQSARGEDRNLASSPDREFEFSLLWRLRTSCQPEALAWDS